MLKGQKSFSYSSEEETPKGLENFAKTEGANAYWK